MLATKVHTDPSVAVISDVILPSVQVAPSGKLPGSGIFAVVADGCVQYEDG